VSHLPGAHSEVAAPPASDQAPVLQPGHSYGSVTDKISSIVLTRGTPRGWLIGFGISFTLLMAFLYATAYLFARGIGIWGTTIPVGWAFPIVNFVWWVGIAHAGTLISAVLLLMHQEWRKSINRFAEAMTLFAVCCAGLSQHDGSLAELSQSSGLGRVRSADIFHRFHFVLVHGLDPRSGCVARRG
jgi:molybdopterin-containing oxidoreductase family membrane subunit